MEGKDIGKAEGGQAGGNKRSPEVERCIGCVKEKEEARERVWPGLAWLGLVITVWYGSVWYFPVPSPLHLYYFTMYC